MGRLKPDCGLKQKMKLDIASQTGPGSFLQYLWGNRSMTDIACIVLAAGMGTRMCSQLPKVLHKAAGRSLVGHVINAANDLGAARIVVVVGDGAAPIEAEVRGYSPDAQIVVQSPARGTGDAVGKALPALDDFEGTVLVLFGADPLMTRETLSLMTATIANGARLAVLGFDAANPSRIRALVDRQIRSRDGHS